MISAIVLTKNEEENIKECLSGLSWCDEIIVIDDESTDKTVGVIGGIRDIGKKVKIFSRKLEGNFAEQRNYGLEKAKGDWVLFVDADERASKKLEGEIREKIREDKGIEGYFIRRIDYFMGKFLKFGEIGGVGGFGGVKILRLAKKVAGRWIRSVDETWEINGRTETLDNPLLHYSHPNLTQFLESINDRSSMNAEYLFKNGEKLDLLEWCKPKLKFINGYFLKMGFLDGMQGFVFAVLMSLHSFMVRGKLYLMLQNANKK